MIQKNKYVENYTYTDYLNTLFKGQLVWYTVMLYDIVIIQ